METYSCLGGKTLAFSKSPHALVVYGHDLRRIQFLSQVFELLVRQESLALLRVPIVVVVLK
jgi:hypothetical protein